MDTTSENTTHVLNRKGRELMATRLPILDPGRTAAVRFVADHLAGLFGDSPAGSVRFKGGQKAAKRQLDRFDVVGYANGHNEVAPHAKRATSGLSPYLRHGILTLAEVWDRVGGGPEADVGAFRQELLWQEYARHWYARLGYRTRKGIQNSLNPRTDSFAWNHGMACIDLSIGELEEDGWLVNQARLWLASHMVVREGGDWTEGEDYFFKHLLDGSRAANRLGWQWATGTGSSRVYGFSRWQVERRAAGLCASCELVHECPIENWPTEPLLAPTETPVDLVSDPDLDHSRGPLAVTIARPVDSVWLTAESLGTRDPALSDNLDVPVIFVFDEHLLRKLQLSSKRLVFLAETLSEIGQTRDLEIWLGNPSDVIRGRSAAATFAPVPGFRRIAADADLAALYPYQWLRTPTGGTVASLDAWGRDLESSEYRNLVVSFE